MLAVAAALSWATRLDHRIAGALHRVALDAPVLVHACSGLSRTAGPWTWEVVGAVAAVVLLLRGHAASAVLVVAVVASAQLSSTVLKTLVDRPRPSWTEPVAHAAGASFPSGHATASLAAVTVLLAVWRPDRRAWYLLGGVLVAAVGFSRVLLGVHYVSDVLAGWALALAWFGVWTAALGRVSGPGTAAARR